MLNKNNELKKPSRLYAGDTIATVSVSHGWAGEPNMLWKYELGKRRLEDIFGLKVQAAPNSMKGVEYLKIIRRHAPMTLYGLLKIKI